MSFMIELFYITNNKKEAEIIDKTDIDWVFIDLEKIGKAQRQENRDTVKSDHSINDISKIKNVLTSTKLLVRCNKIGEWSYNEIKAILDTNKVDMIMLPFFKTIEEVKIFFDICKEYNVRKALLFETIESLELIDQIIKLFPIDYCHFGLNDLHIQRKTKSMFLPFFDGTLKTPINALKKGNIKFGIGGIGPLNNTTLQPEPYKLLIEHYRLGSQGVILSRSFKKDANNLDGTLSARKLEDIIKSFREKEKFIKNQEENFFLSNFNSLIKNGAI